jgi:hypothetical protein
MKVTGHSLGGALAQHFVETVSVLSAHEQRSRSPGGSEAGFQMVYDDPIGHFFDTPFGRQLDTHRADFKDLTLNIRDLRLATFNSPMTLKSAQKRFMQAVDLLRDTTSIAVDHVRVDKDMVQEFGDILLHNNNATRIWKFDLAARLQQYWNSRLPAHSQSCFGGPDAKDLSYKVRMPQSHPAKFAASTRKITYGLHEVGAMLARGLHWVLSPRNPAADRKAYAKAALKKPREALPAASEKASDDSIVPYKSLRPRR